MQTRLGFKSAELIDHAVSARIEILFVALGPPVFQVAQRVKLAARIVVAMGDFMTDDCADRSVVEGIIGVRIEEGRLQNSRRKRDIVVEGVVTGVDSWRSHPPLLPVNWLIDLVEVAHLIKLAGAQDVCQIRITRNGKRRVVDPLIRVADLLAKSIELRDRMLASILAHPV